MNPPGGPADANALTNGAAGAPAPTTTGTVALGHTECDVVRGIGAPDNVNLSNNARGDRVAVVNYSRDSAPESIPSPPDACHRSSAEPSRWRSRRPPSPRRRRSRPQRSRTQFDLISCELVQPVASSYCELAASHSSSRAAGRSPHRRAPCRAGRLLRVALEQIRQRECGVDLGDNAVDARDLGLGV